MSKKTTTKGSKKGKFSVADLEYLALMLSGILAHPALPPELRQHIRYGISEVFNDLDDNERVTDSAEYLSLLFTQHAEQRGGAK